MTSPEPSPATSGPIQYPPARRGAVVDVLHGVRVPDPYRWLEDLDGAETRAWIEAQNRLTEGILSGVAARSGIRERLRALQDYDKYGLPRREGGRVFWLRREGLQNQPVLWVQDGPEAEPRLLLDPNRLSEDGTTSLGAWQPRRDGRLLAYSISEGGSDWRTIRVRDVATGEDLDDTLRWVKFSGISWDAEGEGFYYSRYEAPREGQALEETNYYQKLCYHRVGTPQEADRVVYERPDHKTWGFGGEVTDDGRWLVIHVWEGTSPRNGVFIRDLRSGGEVVELLDAFDAAWDYVGNDGPLFWFFTDRDAPRGRLVALAADAAGPEASREIVPERDATLEAVRDVGGHFVCHYLEDAKSRLHVLRRDGSLERRVELPAMGSVTGIAGKPRDGDFFFAFSSFTFPTTIYRHVVASGTQEAFRRPEVDFDPAAFVTRQDFAESPDGTRVPVFIVHRRDVVPDGQRPVYLYGYGGFNISLTPHFRPMDLVWLEMGGVYAVAVCRGGGEYGEEWHQAGTRTRKQNVFDDFIAVAEWLIEDGWTHPGRLAIGGRSNGGLLVGACITQRPGLFRAALPAVGVLDMLRFHRFTIGWAWTSDFGSPENPEEFRALLAYSPYHNVRPGTEYPAVLATTADHDDRVVPAHSYKFIAALQAAQAGAHPVLIRIETKAGHGAGKPTDKVIDEWTDAWAFLVRELGVRPPAAFLGD